MKDVLDNLFFGTFSQGNIFLQAAECTLSLLIILSLLSLVVSLLAKFLTRVLASIIGAPAAFIVRNYLTFPGTVHHELSHALIAFVLGAKVKRITLIPKNDTLGQVEIQTRGASVLRHLQLSLSAVAPVLCGAVSECLLWFFVLPLCNTVWAIVLLVYIMISILFHMTMSRQDIKNLRQGFLPTVIVIYLIFLLLIFLY